MRPIGRLALVGTGLIGASLAARMRAISGARRVCGFDRDPVALDYALGAALIDEASPSIESAVTGAEVIVVAVPVGQLRAVLAQIAPHLSAQAVVTDVGSVKGSVLQDAREVLGADFARFVGAHPIAGSDRSGPGASRSDLFAGKRVVLCPEPDTDASATATVKALWQACEAEVLTMTCEEHDAVFGALSHLPHVLAYALMQCVGREALRPSLKLAGSGFRDVTRIAASDPLMWRDICLGNRAALLAEIDQFTDALSILRGAIERGDGAALLQQFSNAQRAREGLDVESSL